MRLSELTAEQGLEAIANSLEHIGNIAEMMMRSACARSLYRRKGRNISKSLLGVLKQLLGC